MTREEILDKAIYIQYPLNYKSYLTCNVEGINKLPLATIGMMYDGWHLNTNHFTSEYHRKYSIPLLCDLLHLNFNEDDFVLEKKVGGNGFDMSIYKPKVDYRYEIYGFTRGEHFDNLGFDEITRNDSNKVDISEYHRLYKYSHECSRLINKTLKSDRKLFISGDSQMIPDVSFLSCFFKEIWYFDNRNRLELSHLWKDVDFSDVLIEVNNLQIFEYTNTNLK